MKTLLFTLLTILVNQVGYYPAEEKTAVLENCGKSAVIVDAHGKTVWRGKAVEQTQSPLSGKTRYTVDFSSLTRPGSYTMVAGRERVSVCITEHPLRDVLTLGMGAYYLQRSGEPILEEYAGIYARPMGHPDTHVLIHPSAAGPLRQAGQVISSPRGWYDAGDYNKYIVNSGFSVGIMLSAYEMQPDYYRSLSLNIPEQHNAVPDYLDEILVNLEWMLTMQDPADGGVYHKLTTPDFEKHIRPTDCHQTRYVVQKSTQAALDLAASMAMAARIYAEFPETTDFAHRALEAAEQAFAWAVKNPHVLYDQPGNNERFDPDCTTGMYDDTNAEDEFFWAATELYITTGSTVYQAIARQYQPVAFELPVWGLVSGLGTYSAIAHGLKEGLWAEVREQLVQYAVESVARIPGSAMHSPHGNRVEDFCWGSNGEMCAGQGLALMYAYRITANRKLMVGALENMDWLLGRNALGFCYVTGLGTHRVMHPHHRLSASDDIIEPLPGFLAGGPNPGKQDVSELPYDMYPEAADECYLDFHPSYATNEVTINWNAYLVALCGLLDANLN